MTRMDAASMPSRAHKRAALLRTLRGSAGASRTALANSLGFSQGTARILVDELMDAGLVCAVGVDLSTGGRPSRRVSLNPDGPLVLGVDLSQMEMRLGLFDLRGDVVESRRRSFERYGDQVQLDGIVSEIEQLAATRSQRVVGVGLAVPGYLDAASGLVIFSANLGWHDVELGAAVRDALGIDVLVERNANAAMLAEIWNNPSPTGDPAVFVTMGSGIGVAIQVAGRFLVGAGGAAGEFGHIVIDPLGPECRCGRRGCLEAFASTRAIGERYQQLKGIAPEVSLPPGALASALAAREPEAREAIDSALAALVGGLATLISLVNPEVIILGGDLLHADSSMLDRIRVGVDEHALAHMASQVRIEESRLHEDAPLVGAACLVHEALFADTIQPLEKVS